MRKAFIIALLGVGFLVAWVGSLYFAQDWGYCSGASATELQSPRAFHCQEALGQREMAQLELDDDWRPEPKKIGRGTIILTSQQVHNLQKERRERLEVTIQQAEGAIERFC